MTSAEDAPDYHHVVEHPMDLSTILAELENHKYTKLSDVKDYFQLMFDNCFAYNPSRSVSDIYTKGPSTTPLLSTWVSTFPLLITSCHNTSFPTNLTGQANGVEAKSRGTCKEGRDLLVAS